MALDIATIWEQNVSDFLTKSDDAVTIYYKPVRSGTSTTFDSQFQEGTDPADPSSFSGITETTPSPVTVKGKVNLDLHGASIGSGEGSQQLVIGQFPESDAWFQCLLSSVKTSTDPDPISTVFDDPDDLVNYVLISKDGKKYQVEAVKPRGMGATPYVVDVFLKLTNKEV